MALSVFGIDFGTSNIKIYNGISKTILNEKNIIAIKDKSEVLAFGDEAFEMYEKNPDNIVVDFPIKAGVIADLSNMMTLFEMFYKKLLGTRSGKLGRFCVAVPADITEVQQKAFYDVVFKSNVKAREIKIVEKPLADAVGLGIDMTSSRGNMIVNIGSDTTEISVVSNGGIVISKMIELGGNKIDELIVEVVKKRYNIYIGLKTAEKIKIQLADAMYEESDEDNEEDLIYVYGRNAITGLPSERAISKETVYQAIESFFEELIESIKNLLERTPPELQEDILDIGMYLTGGSAAIKNLDKYIEENTDLVVNTVKNPDQTVIRGISMIVSDNKFKDLMYEPRESSF